MKCMCVCVHRAHIKRFGSVEEKTTYGQQPPKQPPRSHATQAGRANQTILRQRTRAGRRAKTKVNRKGGGQGAYTRPYQPR
uniref:Uncharacterized protein n=1 Tax=Anopheles arabiensis TaxID=7173 RepID=A0A182IGX7_ANOAR